MFKIHYKISITNWDRYNKKSKPSLPHIFLSKRFFDDSKVQLLSNGGKLLYLGLLLRRGEVDTTFFGASHEDLVRFAGGSGQVVSRLMDQLQSLQLLTYEKTSLKRREDKIIEDENQKNNNNQSQDPEKPENQKPVLEIATTENTNSVQGFHARFVDSQKENPFLKTLEEWDLKKPILKNNIHLLEKAFETNEKFVEWLGHIVTRPGYQKAKIQGAVSADNYITKALKSEMGLAV